MTPPLDAKTLWSDLLPKISQMDSNLQQRLFELLLTPEEKKIILNRLAITRDLLVNNNTQRTIAKDLGVSIATITRGSNALKALSFEDYELIKSILLSNDPI
jgi:TrpR family trp operon transcriptional repressor